MYRYTHRLARYPYSHLHIHEIIPYQYKKTEKRHTHLSIFPLTHEYIITNTYFTHTHGISLFTFSNPLNHCNRLNKYPYRQSNNISINMFLQTYLNTYIATLPIHSSAYIYTERQTYSKTILTFSQAYTTTILPYQYT